MTECIALDDDGSPMSYYTMNTISPIEYADEARAISLFHLQQIDCTGENDVSTMLPTRLYDSDGNLTHIMCSRPGYDNTVRNQMATMTAESLNGKDWVSDTYFFLADSPNADIIKSKFCLVLGDYEEFLEYLSLEAR